MISEKKIKEWVDIYLSHIDEITPEVHVREEEGYKFKSVDTFQKNFDIDHPDLADNLEKAIEHNNLVAGSMYWPLKMLLIFAREYEDETRNALKKLFDTEKGVSQRIDEAERKFDELMETRNSRLNEDAHSFIGLRFLSLLLGFYYPDEYNAVKPREWKVFSKFIDENFSIPRHTPPGEQYKFYALGIEELRSHIKSVPQVQELREQLTEGLTFKDKEYRWMAQDVIYVTARVFAAKKSGEELSKEPIFEGISSTDDIESGNVVKMQESLEFPLEEYLENLIVKNWGSMDFGEPLTFYIDGDGTPGQQYTTDVGIIDILAIDKNGDFVVIELKKGRTNDKVVGQILNYMGWVRNNLAEKDQGVRGIIIASDGNQALFSAQGEVSDKVAVKYYRVGVDFTNPNNGNS